MPDPKNRLPWNAMVRPYPAICDPYSFKDIYLDKELSNHSGNYMMNFAPVDPGEVWIVQSIVGVAISQACASQVHYLIEGSDAYIVNLLKTPLAGDPLVSQFMIIMSEGNYIRIYFDTLAAAGWVRGAVVGWKVALY